MPVKKYLKGYIPLDEAIERTISRASVKLETAPTRVEDILDSILAEDIYAPRDIPPRDRSEVDGYAVHSRDLMGASPSSPVTLRLASEGDEPETCIPIHTGEALPQGFDAVCMEEYTERLGGDRVLFYRSVHPQENISVKGLDMKRGEKVLERGKPLTEFDQAALAMLGIASVKVYRRPFIGILNTGDELVPLGCNLGPGQKINSNEVMLSSLLKRNGFNPLRMGIVGDDVGEVAERISKALKLTDALLVTGGTAVGEGDVVPEAVEEAGGEILCRGIAIRPARPTGSAVLRGKPIFMLSGNPVACAVGCLFFALPVLRRIFKVREAPMPTLKGVLTRRVACPPGFRCFVRVRVEGRDGRTYIEPSALRGASLISTLVRSDGFLIVPEEVEGYDEGEEVEVKVFRFLGGGGV